MSHHQVIGFKAGICEVEASGDADPIKITPRSTPGYVYLFYEEDLLHFAWRPRNSPEDSPELDLIMFPGDGSFTPYEKPGNTFKKHHPDADDDAAAQKPTAGRIYVLRFSSSSDRHFFWLQSKSQHEDGDPSWFSPRDRRLGDLVHTYLQGEEGNLEDDAMNGSNDEDGADGDTAMEDAEDGGSAGRGGRNRSASGGAGADATGGDVREEGEEAREGGADGGRATTGGNNQAQAAIASFIKSLQDGKYGGGAQGADGKPFTTLPELLQPAATLPILDSASDERLDELLAQLPPQLVLLSASADEAASADPDPETVQAVTMSLEPGQKKDIIRRVLRSPQFVQGLSSLTMALRDGGLPMISEALKIKVANGGYVKEGGQVPLGGGDAVEAFLEGIKKTVEGVEEENESKMDLEQ